MKFEKQEKLPLIPAGEHVLTLRSVETKKFEDRFGNSKEPDGKVTKAIWRFISNEEDEEGCPYELHVFTNIVYGNPKASMTRLIDNLVPGMTIEAFDEFDSDDLIGKRFKAQIKHNVSDKGDKFADYVYITPIKKRPAAATEAAAPQPAAKPKAKPKPAPDEEEIDEADPFEDE